MVLNGCSCTAVGVHILLKVRELLLRRTTADEHKARVFVPCSSGTAAAAALRSGGTGRCRLCIAGRILTAALAVVCTAALLCALALGGRLAVLAGRAFIAAAARALTAAELLCRLCSRTKTCGALAESLEMSWSINNQVNTYKT